MANPILDALGTNQNQTMLNNFGRFMQAMQGRDPDQMIQQMLQSGQINQQQLNQAQQMAQSMRGLFEPFFKR